MPAQQTMLDRYLQPGVMTTPGVHAPLLADLPGAAALAGVAHGLIIFEHIAGAYGVTLTDAERATVHIRPGQAGGGRRRDVRACGVVAVYGVGCLLACAVIAISGVVGRVARRAHHRRGPAGLRGRGGSDQQAASA